MFARSQQAKQVGAEFDDLVQEGLIAVWVALENGVAVVGPERISDRMRNHMRWLGRARSGAPPVPYDEMLSLNEETVAAA